MIGQRILHVTDAEMPARSMNIRERYAMAAMEQIVHRWSRLEVPWTPVSTERCAKRSVEIADALIAALNEGNHAK